MRRIILALLMVWGYAYGQSVVDLRGDSIRVYKSGGFAEFVLRNSTKDSLGALANMGNGVTKFVRFIKYNDSVVHLGQDSFKVGAASAALDSIAKNGVSRVNKVLQLGQPSGQSGDPAKLLAVVDIPFNGFKMRFLDSLLTSGSKIEFYDTANGSQAPIKIINKKSVAYGLIVQPYNYSTAYASTYRPYTNLIRAGRWMMGAYESANSNGEAMPDNVYQAWSYNETPQAARLDTSDIGARSAFETNYANGGVLGLSAEYHDPEVILFDGTHDRVNSYYINKLNGYCLQQSYVPSQEWYSQGLTSPAFLYANIHVRQNGSNFGALDLYGTGGAGDPVGSVVFNDISGTYTSQSIQVKAGSMYIGTSLNPNQIQLWQSGNIWIGQSASFNPTTWHGTIIGMDSTPTTTPAATAALQVIGEKKGVLVNRMGSNTRRAISSPADGLMVYDTDFHLPFIYLNNKWQSETPVVGQATLISGTLAVTITGVNSSNAFGFVSLVSASATTLTTTYQAVPSTNTLTLRANIAAGTINTADGSTVNYQVYIKE